jgi:SAM-dependent methyltransferase
LPFASAQFDANNFSEVIEHLGNPRVALKEILRCLRPGGIFFLTTNNRHGLLWSDWLNPICVGEKILGLVFPSLLPPPALVWKHDGYGLSFYHTNFTFAEIVALIHDAELDIVWHRSYGHFGEIHQAILKLFPAWTERQVACVLHWLDRCCNSLPVLNRLGMAWLIVGRKPGEPRQAN